MNRPIALEIFSGSGHFSKSWRMSSLLNDVPIFELDIKHGCAFDLSKKHLRALVAGWIKSGLICAVWLGTPCSSWTMARRGKPGGVGGPPPLRSREHFMGLPGLSDKDNDRVALGNCLMQFSSYMLRLCHAGGIFAVMENPIRQDCGKPLRFARLLLLLMSLLFILIFVCLECLGGSVQG